MVIWAFLVFAVLAVVFTTLAVVHRSPVVNVLSLVLVFFFLAAIYAIIGMGFLAAIQLIVYSGAVLVLFLFVIMLLNIRRVERFGSGRPFQAALGATAAVAVGALIVWAIGRLQPVQGAVVPGLPEGGTAALIGHELMTTYLFPFELISVVLVAALVGAIALARRES
jgi:NADH-quinone oxidoreductase subunit J